MKSLLLTLLSLAATAACFAQRTGDSLYFLLPRDTLQLRFDAGTGELLFDHYLSTGQSLYGTAKFYGLGLEDVYLLNPQLRTAYQPGDRVRVPIPKRAIQTSISRDSVAWFTPVRYQLAPGETLFGLARRTLGWADEAILLRLNPGLNPQTLSAGTILNLGYFKIDGIPPEWQGELEDPYVRQNRGLRELWEQYTPGKKLSTVNGKAAWTKKGDTSKWMALHRTAPLNSLIEIDDPRSRKKLYARVVGRIPEQIYGPNVIVVVSPLLAKAFGVRDNEFYVRTRHF